MRRTAIVVLSLLVAAPAAAQNYAGAWSARHPSGSAITLTLAQDARGEVTGKLEGNGNSFEIEAEAKPEGLLGMVIGDNAMVYLMGKLSGAQLRILLVEPGPGGQPNMQSAREIVFARAGAPGKPAAKGPPAKPAAPAASGVDGQLTQLLTRNPWCSFSYNQTSGTSRRERVVFRTDGVVLQQSGAETYSSGSGGVVAGDHRGAGQGRWRVSGGSLHLSEDGATWTPQPLQVTQNSNGYPIIKSGGKEYMQCN